MKPGQFILLFIFLVVCLTMLGCSTHNICGDPYIEATPEMCHSTFNREGKLQWNKIHQPKT